METHIIQRGIVAVKGGIPYIVDRQYINLGISPLPIFSPLRQIISYLCYLFFLLTYVFTVCLSG